MTYSEIIILGIGLSMDAFAVSVCKGLSMKRFIVSHAVIIAGSFGVFQALMPLIGWFAGKSFAQYIESFDHWVAFALLSFIGIKMIIDAARDIKKGNTEKEYSLRPAEMMILSVATSIDALAVGLSFAMLNMPAANTIGYPGIWMSVMIIGIITFILSFCGVYIGFRFGKVFETAAQFIGGGILIIIGVKILLEHLGVI